MPADIDAGMSGGLWAWHLSLSTQQFMDSAKVPSRFNSHGPLRGRTALWCLFLCLSLVGGVAVAADDLATIPLDQLLDLEVSGVSKLSLRQSESPSSATVIGGDEIRALGYRTLGEALQSVRGLVVTSDRTSTYLGVRGFSVPGDYNTRVLLLIDGNRVNDTVFDQAFLGSEFPVDLALIERIEFIPGQGSAVHGGNALFGVINVVTRGVVGNSGAQAAVTLGSGGLRQWRGFVNRRVADDAWLLVSATTRRYAGTDASYPGGPDGAPAVSHRTDAESAQQLLVKYEKSDLWASLALSDRTKGLTAYPGTVFGDSRSAYRDSMALAGLGWSEKVDAQNTWTLRGYAGSYWFRGDFLVDYPPVTLNQDRAESLWWGLEGTWLSKRIGGHNIVGGFDFNWSPRRDQSNADLEPAATYFADRGRSRRQSVFVEDQWTLSAASSITLGLRHDHLTGDAHSNQLSPRLAFVTHASDAVVLKLIHGSAFRPPNAYESRYATDGTIDYKGNAALQNERVRGTEGVIEYRPTAETLWTLALYENVARQLVVQRLDPLDGKLAYANAGAMRARGFEIEGERIWAGGFRARGSYSVQRVANDTVADLSLRTPTRLAKLVLIAPLSGEWTLASQTSLVSRRADVAGQGVTNLTVSRKWAAEHGVVSLSVYDVFDRRPQDPGSDSVLQPVVPQDGRMLAVRVEWKF